MTRLSHGAQCAPVEVSSTLTVLWNDCGTDHLTTAQDESPRPQRLVHPVDVTPASAANSSASGMSIRHARLAQAFELFDRENPEVYEALVDRLEEWQWASGGRRI